MNQGNINMKAITLRNSNIANNTMSLRDILSPSFGNTHGPSAAQMPASGSSGKRPQSSGNFFRGAANVN